MHGDNSSGFHFRLATCTKLNTHTHSLFQQLITAVVLCVIKPRPKSKLHWGN